MKSSAEVLSNDIPAGAYFHIKKFNTSHINTLCCRIFTSQPRPTLLYKIRPPAEVFPNTSPLGTARIISHRCRLSYLNCESPVVVHRNAANRLMRKSSQVRTEHIKIPQVNYSPSSSPRGPVFPKPYYTWRCCLTLQDYLSTPIRARAEAIHLKYSHHKKL